MKNLMLIGLLVLFASNVFAQQDDCCKPEIITVKTKTGEEYEVVSVIGPKNRYQNLIEKIKWEEWQKEKEKHNFQDTEEFYHRLPLMLSKEPEGLAELNQIKSSVLHRLIEYGLGDVEDLSKISYFAEEILTHRYYFMPRMNEDNGDSKLLKKALPKLRGYWSDEVLETWKTNYLAFYEKFVEFNKVSTKSLLELQKMDAESIRMYEQSNLRYKNFEEIITLIKNL